MYIPSSFAESDERKLFDFIERNSFATLVTHNGGETIASHLPLLLDREVEPTGKLIGHMARANSQWKHADGQEAVAIFHGPHAYISPSWYEEQNVVPTWNYVAVHVHGTLRIISDEAVLLKTLQETVVKYESGFEAPWLIDQPDQDFLTSLLASIVGFEIEITRIEGKWKLSQNHTAERRMRVVSKLRDRGGEPSSAIADLMEGTLKESTE